MTSKSSNKLVTFLSIFYYWLRGIVMFFVPRSMKSKSVKGELVLITGGGGGLGRALAVKFANLGANIVVWDINESGLNETVDLVKPLGVKVRSYICDITDRHAVYETAARVKDEVGVVNILVNNAGVVSGKNLLDIPDEKILQTFHVNAISHFWTVKAFLPDMITANHGHLVAIASIAGQSGVNQLSDYCASKFASVGFEESMRFELMSLGVTGVKSTVVMPYFINTGMFAGFKTTILQALEPDYIAEEIVSGVLIDVEHVVIPKLFFTLSVFKTILPVKALYKLYEFLGGFDCMTDFTGKEGLKSACNNNINSIDSNDNYKQKVN